MDENLKDKDQFKDGSQGDVQSQPVHSVTGEENVSSMHTNASSIFENLNANYGDADPFDFSLPNFMVNTESKVNNNNKAKSDHQSLPEAAGQSSTKIVDGTTSCIINNNDKKEKDTESGNGDESVSKANIQPHVITELLLEAPDSLTNVSIDLVSSSKETISNQLSQILPHNNNSDNSVKIPNNSQEHLLRSINVLEMFTQLLEYIIKPEQLCHIQSITFEVVELLFTIYQQCFDIKFYDGNSHDLEKIRKLFSMAQEIHSKSSVLLNYNVENAILSDIDMFTQNNVREVFTEFGKVITSTEVSTLADNWNDYLSILQKLANALFWNNFSFGRILNFVSSEICQMAQKLLEKNSDGENKRSDFLKVYELLIKIHMASYNFWSDSVYCNVLNFALPFFSYYPAYLKFRKHPKHVVDQIEELIFPFAYLLIDKIIYMHGFYDYLPQRKKELMENTKIAIFFITTIFQKISRIVSYAPLEERDIFVVNEIIKLFFEIAAKNHADLFWRISVFKGFDTQFSLYCENIINISILILALNEEQYKEVEMVLLRNVLKSGVSNALLSTDIWTLVLRHKCPSFTYKILCNLVAEILCTPINKSVFFPLINYSGRRIENVLVGNLLRQIFKLLTDEYKLKVVYKYPVNTNMHVWKAFGFADFPDKFIIDSLMNQVIIKYIKSFNCKKNVNDFYFLCNAFDAISAGKITYVNLKLFLSSFVTLWDSIWNFDIAKYSQYPEYSEVLSDKILKVTYYYIMKFNDEQLFTILTKLQETIHIRLTKLWTINILFDISVKSFSEFLEDQIILVISELFEILRSDRDGVIKQRSIVAFEKFAEKHPIIKLYKM